MFIHIFQFLNLIMVSGARIFDQLVKFKKMSMIMIYFPIILIYSSIYDFFLLYFLKTYFSPAYF